MRDSSSDHALVAALRRGDFTAWNAYTRRFQPALQAYAHGAGIPREHWDVCIEDVLTDEALRLSTSSAPPPRNLTAYLITAARHRYFALRRSGECRHRHHVAASNDAGGESVVATACSEAALRAGIGVDTERPSASPGVLHLARALDARLTSEERLVLDWVAEGISRPIIAEWLGISSDACTKRVWRLCHRLRADAMHARSTYSPCERRDIDRVLRRAGAIM